MIDGLYHWVRAIVFGKCLWLVKRADKRPMKVWNWKRWQGKPFLTCGLLPQPHGFFTQHFYPQPPEELVLALSPQAQVYRVKQVHSAKVLSPTEIEGAIALGLPLLENGQPAPFPLADGIVSVRSHQAVWACSADCTPALIADVVTGQVAAVHAGWRGTAQKILPRAVERMRAQGSQLKNLRIALGPAIDGQVYQVGHDVATEVAFSVFPAQDSSQGKYTKAAMLDGSILATRLNELAPTASLAHGILSEDAIAPLASAEARKDSNSSGQAFIAALMAMENPPLLADQQGDRLRLDVRRINQLQLEQLGIAREHIAIAPHCTYQDPENFFSYRRAREKKVQWSGIVSA